MKEGTVGVFEDKAIMRLAMKRRGLTQTKVAEKLGVVHHAVSSNMTRSKIGLGTFVKMMDAMEYDVYIIDRQTGEALWCVDVPKNPEK